MKPDFGELDRRVAQARVVLSLLLCFSLYVDPSLGGLFHLDKWLLTTLLCYLMYSALTYLALSYRVQTNRIRKLSTGLDLIFATAIAFLTEGRTSPSFVFFVFAIVAVGFRTGFRDTILVTFCSVALYVSVVAMSDGLMNIYNNASGLPCDCWISHRVLRAGACQLRDALRQLEAEAGREAIARSLHDGYIQSTRRDKPTTRELPRHAGEQSTRRSACRDQGNSGRCDPRIR